MKAAHLLGLLLGAGACLHSTAVPRAIPTGDLAADLDWAPVTSVLDSAVRAGVAPGAVLGVSVGGRRMT